MGKSKKNRVMLNANIVPGIAQHMNAGGVIKKLKTDLSSGLDEQKECACKIVASIVDENGAPEQIVQCGLVALLSHVSFHSNPSLQIAALGALRNLSTKGNAICNAMVKQDVVALCAKFFLNFQEIRLSDVSHAHGSHESLVHAAHLLWNLCDGSEEAIEIFTRDKISTLLLPLLNTGSFGIDASVAVAQCLLTVSEDNYEFAKQVETLDVFTSAIALSDVPLFRILTARVVINIVLSCATTAPQGLADILLNVISETLAMDGKSLLNELLSVSPTPTLAMNSENVAVPSNDQFAPNMDLEVKYKRTEELVVQLCDLYSAQQCALELVTNLCCNSEDGDTVDYDDTCVTEEMDITEIPRNTVVTEISNLLCSTALLSTILGILDTTEYLVAPLEVSSHSHLKVSTALSSVKERACYCLCNLLPHLSDTQADTDYIYQVWCGMRAIMMSSINDSLMQSACTTFRAATRALCDHPQSPLVMLQANDITIVMTLGHQSVNDDIRALAINTLAILGARLANESPVPELFRNIGVFLACSLQRESSLWLLAEILDAVIDVFSADHTDHILAELRLVERLQHMSPLFYRRIKAERELMAGHAPVIMTAKSNLKNFIDYKTEKRN